MAEVKKKLPRLDEKVYKRIVSLNPVLIAIPGGPKERLSKGIIALKDAVNTGNEVVYALHESMVHLQKYKQGCPDGPAKFKDIFYSKYYVDDAALRIYPAGEHLAEFVIDFMGIDIIELQNVPDGKKKISKASRLGTYLQKEKQDHDITKLLQKLISNKNWKKAIEYRNKWVHDQPPLLEGMGIQYKRRNRWEKYSSTKYRLHFGGGDKPEYKIDELVETLIKATDAFWKLVSALAQMLFIRLGTIKESFEKKNLNRAT